MSFKENFAANFKKTHPQMSESKSFLQTNFFKQKVNDLTANDFKKPRGLDPVKFSGSICSIPVPVVCLNTDENGRQNLSLNANFGIVSGSATFSESDTARFLNDLTEMQKYEHLGQ